MGTCKACWWWGAKRRESADFDYRICRAIDAEADIFGPGRNLGAGAVIQYEDSQGSCDLLTGPNFGCVLFTTEEPPKPPSYQTDYEKEVERQRLAREGA